MTDLREKTEQPDFDMLIHDLQANLQMMEMADEEWVIQDGSSWRRIGTRTGRHTDGTVLRPYVAPDGQPDIQSAYGVLMHIRLSQPRNVRRLLDEIERLRQELAETRAKALEHAARLVDSMPAGPLYAHYDNIASAIRALAAGKEG